MIKVIMSLFKTTYFIYLLILFIGIFGGGSIIRLYGNTCGLTIFDISSWGSSMMLIGSPWCHGLNWLGHMSTKIVENIWSHFMISVLGLVFNYVPKSVSLNDIDGRTSNIVFTNKLDTSNRIDKKID